MMTTERRKTGIEVVGDLPWGTHFCHFYLTKQDLLDTLVPYFTAGLANGEFCVWVLSPPLTMEEAVTALRRAGPDLAQCLAKGNMELLSHDYWYLQGGAFDPQRVMGRWKEKLQQSLAGGYAGLRFSGDTGWIRKQDWREFYEYERGLDLLIANQRIIASCSYPLAGTGAAEFLDVARTHQVAVAIRNGSWEVLEPIELKQAKSEIKRLNEQLERRVMERTRELAETNDALRREIAQREVAEESLRQAQRRTESVLSSVADIHILFDPQWRYLYVNEAAVRAIGRPREQVLGRTLWELFPDIVGTQLAHQYSRAMEERVPVAFEFYYPTTDSWWENRFFPSPEGLAVFATDVTKRKKAEEALLESEKRFRSYFELGLVGTAITSPDKGFLEVNDKFTEIFGYARNEMMRMTWAQLCHPDDLASDVAQFNRVLAGEIDGYSLETRYRRKDGELIWAQMSVKCLRRADGSVDYLVAHLQDITQRKRSEDKILAYQEQLRSMAAEIAFVEERERHKIATALHDQVGQTLAMTNIKLGQLRQSADSGKVGGLVEEIREMLAQAIGSARTLTFELSPPILYDLGLEAAVCSLAESYQKQHDIRIFCLDDRQPKPLSDDMRVLLFQGVRELLVNAVKHAKAEKISIFCRREGAEIRVVVEDDGVGFTSADAENLTGKNHGFGLFSLRERLKYLGGSLAITSVPGRGTQVALTAPLELEPERRGEAA